MALTDIRLPGDYAEEELIKAQNPGAYLQDQGDGNVKWRNGEGGILSTEDFDLNGARQKAFNDEMTRAGYVPEFDNGINQDAISRSQATQQRGIKTLDDYYRHEYGNGQWETDPRTGKRAYKGETTTPRDPFDMGLSEDHWTGKLTLAFIAAVSAMAAGAAAGGGAAAEGGATASTSGGWVSAEGGAGYAGGAAADAGALGAGGATTATGGADFVGSDWAAGNASAMNPGLASVAPEGAGTAAGADAAWGVNPQSGVTQESLLQTINTGAPTTTGAADVVGSDWASGLDTAMNASNASQSGFSQYLEPMMKWAKDNQLLASTATSMAGGLIKGAMSPSLEDQANAAANARANAEKQIADQIRANNNLAALSLARLKPTGKTVRKAGELPPGIVRRAMA